MSFLNLAPQAVNQNRPGMVRATVSDHKPVPSSFNDPLYVVLPHQPDYFHKIVDWPADHGNTLPGAGTECLLAYDDYGELWCVRWKGSHS